MQKVSGIGGSERHLLSLLPALAEAGVEVRMFVRGDGPRRASSWTGYESSGSRSLDRAGGPGRQSAAGRLLRREMRDVSARPSVHTHLIHADLHGQLAARLTGVPGVSSVHGTPSFYLREPYRTARRIAGRWTSRTIAISEHVRGVRRADGFRSPGHRSAWSTTGSTPRDGRARTRNGPRRERPRNRERRGRGGGGLAVDPRQGALDPSRRVRERLSRGAALATPDCRRWTAQSRARASRRRSRPRRAGSLPRLRHRCSELHGRRATRLPFRPSRS